MKPQILFFAVWEAKIWHKLDITLTLNPVIVDAQRDLKCARRIERFRETSLVVQ